MLQQHNFTGPTTFAARGRLFHFATSDSSVSGRDGRIAIFAEGQSLGVFVAGDSIELDQAVSAWEVVPIDAALTGTVLIGNGTIRSSRVSGSVEVIDNAAAKTLAGKQYYGGLDRTAAAGLYSMVLLYSQDRTIALKAISMRTGTAGNLGFYTALGTAAAPDAYLAVRDVRNKSLSSGLTIPGVRMYRDDSTTVGSSACTVPMTNVAFSLLFSKNVSTDSVNLNLTTPFILPPGTGIAIVHSGAAVNLSCEFDLEDIS